MVSHVKVEEYWAASSSNNTSRENENLIARDQRPARYAVQDIPQHVLLYRLSIQGGSSESLVSLDAMLASQASGNRRVQCHGLGARVAVGGVLE